MPRKHTEVEPLAETQRVRGDTAPERDRFSGRGPFASDLEGARAALAAIVDSSDDAIVGKDLSGKILAWNAGAERMFGYRPEEVVGRPVTLLIPPERRGEEDRILATLVRGDRVDHFETERVRKDGTRITVSLSVSPIKDRKGRIVGAAKIARDITQAKISEREREELLRDAEHARRQAERANLAKDEFLAMLGHELRNPLAAIGNAMTVLSTAGAADPRAIRSRAVVERQVRHLTRMVDDLLDVARVTTGKVELALEPLNVAQSIKQTISALTAAGKTHHLAVEVDVEPVWVAADPTRFEQILSNLLGNAAKYTPAGGTIRVSAGAEGDAVVVRVQDTGVGIRPDVLPRVFDLFRQGDPTLDRSQGGLGIGLTLARRLVEMHGGSLEAASEGVGRGSLFTLRLSRIVPPAPLDERPPAATGVEGRRIILVEDNADVRDSFRLLLEATGHEVHEAADGPSGVEVARRVQPDIAFIDVGLPGFSGYEVAARLRETTEGVAMIMVALTGYGQPEDRHRALAAGFDLHLVKPVRPEDLYRVLKIASQRSG